MYEKITIDNKMNSLPHSDIEDQLHGQIRQLEVRQRLITVIN